MTRHPALLLIALAACRPAPAPTAEQADAAPSAPAALSDADVAAIRAADSAFAASASAGDVAGVAAVYAADASLLPPNAPAVKGTAAIQEYWGGFLAAYDAKFELMTDHIEGRGDLGYTTGRYKLTAKPKTKGPPAFEDEGKYVEIVKRQADGSWRYAVDIYNSDRPVK